MLKICAATSRTIAMPRSFTMESMHSWLDLCIDAAGDARHAIVDIDFSQLRYIDPTGVVVLSNLIEYFRLCGVSGLLSGLYWKSSDAICYLDDAGFFERYNEKPLREHAAPRAQTMPLRLVENIRTYEFLFYDLIPWMARQLGTSEEALATVRVCAQEILQNIADHSGVGVGCVHAQYFPSRGIVEVAFSDFGQGIPQNVRKIAPQATDSQALRLACNEGFTTQSNVHNRGAGLPTLINYLASRDRGVVRIASGKANIFASFRNGTYSISSRSKQSSYPGTLVVMQIKKSAVPDLAEDIEKEDFKW